MNAAPPTYLRLPIVIALAYSMLVAMVFIFQRSMLYQPPHPRVAKHDIQGLEEFKLQSSDGVKLAAWHVPPADGRPVIVYFYGNAEQLSSGVDLFRKMAEAGYGLVAIDYRGYGGSEGTPTESGLIVDGHAALKFAADRYGADRLVVWGYSLGSGVAVALASQQKVRAVVLEAPFSSTLDVAADRFWFLPVRWLMLDTFRSDLRIKDVHAPLLILHGDEDETIPIRFGRRLFDLANEPKTFRTLVGADHYYLDNFGATDEAFRFIRKTVMDNAQGEKE